MRHPSQSPGHQRLQLAAGAATSLRLPRGATLLVLGGQVLMQHLQPEIGMRTLRLGAGQADLADEDRWVVLTACGDSELVAIAPEPAEWRRRIRAAWRGLTAHAQPQGCAS